MTNVSALCWALRMTKTCPSRGQLGVNHRAQKVAEICVVSPSLPRGLDNPMAEEAASPSTSLWFDSDGFNLVFFGLVTLSIAAVVSQANQHEFFDSNVLAKLKGVATQRLAIGSGWQAPANQCNCSLYGPHIIKTIVHLALVPKLGMEGNPIIPIPLKTSTLDHSHEALFIDGGTTQPVFSVRPRKERTNKRTYKFSVCLFFLFFVCLFFLFGDTVVSCIVLLGIPFCSQTVLFGDTVCWLGIRPCATIAAAHRMISGPQERLKLAVRLLELNASYAELQGLADRCDRDGH